MQILIANWELELQQMNLGYVNIRSKASNYSSLDIFQFDMDLSHLTTHSTEEEMG